MRYSLVILMFLVSVSPAIEPPEDHAYLTSTNWSASVLSHRAGGSVCWLLGDDGSVRVEVLLDPEGTGDDDGQAYAKKNCFGFKLHILFFVPLCLSTRVLKYGIVL